MINRVVLVGRLTRNPSEDLRQTQNGISNLRFTVAVNRNFTNQNGERPADFINCVAWRQTADNMAKFLRKGSLVGVEGRIETGSYQAQDGTTRYTTDVNAESVQFLEPRSSNQNTGEGGFGGGNTGFNPSPSGFGGGNAPAAPASNSFGAVSNANPFPNESKAPDFNSTIDISDDDLPF